MYLDKCTSIYSVRKTIVNCLLDVLSSTTPAKNLQMLSLKAKSCLFNVKLQNSFKIQYTIPMLPFHSRC